MRARQRRRKNPAMPAKPGNTSRRSSRLPGMPTTVAWKSATPVSSWQSVHDGKNAMRTLLIALVLGALPISSHGQSREIVGYLGELGEWELTATVPGDARSNDFSGPVKLRHVGICTQDGPEEKTGEIRGHLSPPSPELRATLSVDGVECAYRGRQSDSYEGLLKCPNRRPVPLTLWIK